MAEPHFHRTRLPPTAKNGDKLRTKTFAAQHAGSFSVSVSISLSLLTFLPLFRTEGPSHSRRKLCKHHTAPRAFHTRKHFLACALKGLNQALHALFFCVCLEIIFILAGHVSCAVIVAWPLYYFICTVVIPAIHTWEDRVVDWLNKVFSQVMSPNVTVEASSTEVTFILLPSRRASFGSTYDSGEDVTTTPASSEVDESMRMLASPLFTQHVDRTPCRTHIFISIVVSRTYEHTGPSHAHACGSGCSQELCCPLAHSKVIPSHSMFHRTLLGVPDTFSSFCSSPPQTTPTSRQLPGIRKVQNARFSKAESANMALCELNRQIHSHRVELYHTGRAY